MALRWEKELSGMGKAGQHDEQQGPFHVPRCPNWHGNFYGADGVVLYDAAQWVTLKPK